MSIENKSQQPAPQEAESTELQGLTAEEQEFLTDYKERLDSLLEKVGSQPGREVSTLMTQLFRPDTWRILMNMRKAEQVLDKTTKASTEYEQRAAAVEEALQEFQALVKENPHALN